MPLAIADTVATVRAHLAGARQSRAAVGLVPTLGALHEGHASLIRQARSDCDLVIVSVFVNPLQFDRQDDLERYPRTLDADADLCARLGVDTIFAPAAGEMYPREPACSIEVGRMADHLCGRFRPGHFRGVATVVMKLFQIVQPDMAYFGEKDAQQLAIVRRLVSDFNVPVVIVGMPTVREPDGLALSSRNQRLSRDERSEATMLFRTLEMARARIEAGATDPEAVKQDVTPGGAWRRAFEYLEIVEPDGMQPVERITGPVIIAGALWVGRTRLIDNVRAVPPVS